MSALPSNLARKKRRRGVRGNRGKAVTRPSYRIVTLAGLDPATSPAPGENKDALSPLELQRRDDPYDDLWRRKGGRPEGTARITHEHPGYWLGCPIPFLICSVT